MAEGTRIDKWLWAVRIFKTRSQATEACRSGKVRRDGLIMKASHEVKKGDIYEIRNGATYRTVSVTDILDKRVSAKLAVNYMADLTPQEESDKLKIRGKDHFELRPKGIGRPTKKERRMIDFLKDNE